MAFYSESKSHTLLPAISMYLTPVVPAALYILAILVGQHSPKECVLLYTYIHSGHNLTTTCQQLVTSFPDLTPAFDNEQLMC